MNNRHDRGSISVIVALAIVPMFAVVAAVTEAGSVLVQRQELQTGVEAAVLHAAEEWADGETPCADVALDISRNHAPANAPTITCQTTGTSLGGTVTVAATTTDDLLLGALIGRDSATITATATAAVGRPISATGLRPVALCAQHPAITAWAASGFTDSSTHTIAVESDGDICGGEVPGNWAMMDFDGGSNSNATLQTWVVNGYPGTVDVPSTVPGDPGIPTPAIDIDSLIGTTVTVPVFDTARLNGSTAEFDLSGFVSVEIVDVVMTGAAANRHIDLRFVSDSVGESATNNSGLDHFGISSWRLCALDGNGTCP